MQHMQQCGQRHVPLLKSGPLAGMLLVLPFVAAAAAACCSGILLCAEHLRVVTSKLKALRFTALLLNRVIKLNFWLQL
jgi:hypothetical protein